VAERLCAVDWKTLEKIFVADGFRFVRQSASHRSYMKPGCARPVIIPTYGAVGVEIIMRNMRTAGMTRDRYFHLLRSI
jgi:predicted RNA binding protein YcfA (HicA-like mRNA interferase family)